MGVLTYGSGPMEGETSAIYLGGPHVPLSKTRRLQESIQAARNINEADIEYSKAAGNAFQYCPICLQHHISQFGSWFKSLKIFTIFAPCLSNHRGDGYNSEVVLKCIEEANKALGVPGKLTTVYAGKRVGLDRYIWLAEEGKSLTSP
jgi:hypothetical protein